MITYLKPERERERKREREEREREGETKQKQRERAKQSNQVEPVIGLVCLLLRWRTMEPQATAAVHCAFRDLLRFLLGP